MSKWRLLKKLVLFGYAILLILVITRGMLFPSGGFGSSIEPVIDPEGDWGWLVGILYAIVQHEWLLMTFLGILIAAELFLTVMEIREEGFHLVKLISTIITIVIMVGSFVRFM